jgi:hypothetical protein
MMSSVPAHHPRQAILVLGMHRSGTSAVSGVIEARGASAPKTLMPALPANPRGYFESSVISMAHDAMLASAGSGWDDWRQFDPQSISSDVIEYHRHKIKTSLIDEFGDAPLIFIKDPRICRFLPFTLSILSELNIDPVAILPVRNPLEVAYSLRQREGMALSTAMLLWLRHVLDAEYHSRQLPRYFLPYEKFLIDWRGHMNRAAEAVGLIWPDCSESSDKKIEQFLTPDLRREKASVDEFKDSPDVTSLVRETYEILTKIVESGESNELLGRLDRLRSKFDEGSEIFGASIAAERSLFAVERESSARERSEHAAATARERSEHAAECERLSNENSALLSARDKLFASRSWRLTAPLRRLGSLFAR